MDLHAALLALDGRKQAEVIVGWIGNDPKRFALLMQLFLQPDEAIARPAGHVMSVVAEKNSLLAHPYIKDMVARMQVAGVHDSIKRHVVRVLQHLDIPEDLHADVMNVCFGMLANVNEAIAVRCFSMTILSNLAILYPDIKNELISILQDTLELDASAGFKSRAAKTMKALTK